MVSNEVCEYQIPAAFFGKYPGEENNITVGVGEDEVGDGQAMRNTTTPDATPRCRERLLCLVLRPDHHCAPDSQWSLYIDKEKMARAEKNDMHYFTYVQNVQYPAAGEDPACIQKEENICAGKIDWAQVCFRGGGG